MDVEKRENRLNILTRAVKHLEDDHISAAIYNLLIYAKMVKKRIYFFSSLLKDKDLQRKIGLIDNLKKQPDTAIEYYDKDKDSDPFEYDAATEDKIMRIKEEAAGFIADAIKTEEGQSIEEFLEQL